MEPNMETPKPWRPDNWAQMKREIIKSTPRVWGPSMPANNQVNDILENMANTLLVAYTFSNQFIEDAKAMLSERGWILTQSYGAD